MTTHRLTNIQQNDSVVIEAAGAFSIDVLPSAVSIATDWSFPVQNPADWYCAVQHDLTGKKNGGYRHSGIDLNLDKSPWGDVERGYPVLSLASGVVTASSYSAGWLGVVQVRYQHEGADLYVRYAHLEKTELYRVSVGDMVSRGEVLGFIGNWTGGDGGDHLHLDMATDPFYWGAWLQSSINWIDPVEVLNSHLDNDIVTALLTKK